MNALIKSYLLVCMLFISHVAISQQISGTIRGDRGEGISGATIQVKNKNVYAASNTNGGFTIEANAGEILVISHVSFLPLEAPARNGMVVDLKGREGSLDDVVVIGYGTTRKGDLTGAVSSVKTKDLVLSQGPEVGNMLKGKVAGLTIRQNSAQPGGGLDILIRGAGSVLASNDPLIVVDGFPISDFGQPNNGGRYVAGTQSVLSSFNPNDIESIEVLKDASSTAIYGARAANGVILITTKKGKEGLPRVEYSGNYTIQPWVNPFDVMPLNEWMQVRNEAGYEQWLFDNQVAPWGSRTLEEATANPINGPYRRSYTDNAIKNVGKGTDWLSLVTRTGRTMQHNLSISGGTKATQYLISGNVYKQDGVVKNSDFDRYSLRANIDQQINRLLKVGLNFTASRINNNNSQLGGDQWENSGIIRAAIQQGPHILAIDEFGNYPLNPQLSLQPNPYSLLTITDKGRVERMLINTYLDFTPVKDLLFKLKLGTDRGYSERNNYMPKTTIHGNLEKGRASMANINKDDYLVEGTANYKILAGDNHKVDLLAGASIQKFNLASNSVGNSGFLTDAFLWNNLNAGAGTKTVSSYASKNSFASYFGRVNYNYGNRYLLTLTMRRDGASVFARNKKWGNFPSAALAWNVAEESFLKDRNTALNQLKIRFSYGQTGNASIGSNAFAAYSPYPAWLSGNDDIYIGVSLSRLENPDLKWETTTEANLGIDFGFLNNRIDGSIELYNKVISDLLDVKPINSYNEVNTVMANIGKTQSRGFEVTINSRNILKQDFSWRTTLAVSKFRDTWLERAPDWKPAVYMSAKDPIRAMYYRRADGILQANATVPASQPQLVPGQIMIQDIDGFQRDAEGNPAVDENGRFLRTGKPDGLIDEADTKLLGTADPKMVAGLSNIFTYKNWSLNFDFNGMFGRKMADPNFFSYGMSAYGVYSNGYNAIRSVKNRWTPTNPSTTHPSSFWGFSPYGIGDFFLQDAWFIRLQNVALGYTLPQKITGKVFNSVRLNAAAYNLLVITPYTGVDPETDSYTAAYPNLRSYTFGVNIVF